MSDADKKVILLVRPNGAGPHYWPWEESTLHGRDEARAPGKPILLRRPSFGWMTIQHNILAEDGEERVAYDGHTAGIDYASALPWRLAGDLMDAWFEQQEEDESPWTWEFMLMFPPEATSEVPA